MFFKFILCNALAVNFLLTEYMPSWIIEEILFDL